MFNTITQNIVDDNSWRKGLLEARKNAAQFYSDIDIVNEAFTKEALGTPEMEALADEQMYNGKGIRRYDGTWVSPEDVLDDNLFSDDLMRITYEQDQAVSARKFKMLNELGFLGGEDNQTIKDYLSAATPEQKQMYYDALDGKVKDALKTIDKIDKDNELNGIETPIQGRFYLAADEETGQPYWQEVLLSDKDKKKLELAGISLVNAYGRNKYSDGAIKSGLRSFVKGVADMVPNVMDTFAAAGDLFEATSNLITNGEFKSVYSIDNEDADAVRDYLDDSLIGKSSVKANAGTFDNWEGFISGLGQGAASLVEYYVLGRALRSGLGLVTDVTKAVGNAAAASKFSKLAEAGKQVSKALSAESITDETLGTTAKILNKALIENPETVAMYGAGIVLNFGEAYQSAKQAGIPLEDAATIGFVTGILNTLVEQKYGPNRMQKWLVGGKGATKAAEAVTREIKGDITKLSDKTVSNNIINKVLQQAGDYLGAAFEEGSEEVMQNYTRVAVEQFYDYAIAPNNATAGKGAFGSDVMSKQNLIDALGEGVIGAVLGLGGSFVHSRTKENDSIIPFIANGDFDTLKAGAKIALSKGAISQQQYDGIMSRATALNELRNSNSQVFANIITTTPTELQLDKSNAALKVLRDQKDFAESTADLSSGTSLEDNENKLSDLINRSLQITSGTEGISALSRQLRNNGKKTEADRLDKIVKQANSVSDKVFGNKLFDNKKDRAARRFAKDIFNKHVFQLLNNTTSTANRINIANRLIQDATDQTSLEELNKFYNTNKEILKSNERIQKLVEEYKKANTTAERREQIKQLVKLEINKQSKEFTKNKKLSGLLGFEQYYKNKLSITLLETSKTFDQTELEYLQSDESVKQWNDFTDTVDQEMQNVRQQQQQQQKRQEETRNQQESKRSAEDPQMETQYSEYKNSLAVESQAVGEVSEERKKYIDDVVNGDELTQVNALEKEVSQITKILNNMSKEERSGARGDLLKADLAKLTKFVKYLRQKYDIVKSEADKNKRYKAKLDSDESIYTDPEGKTYKVNRPATQYSENDGLVLEITEQGEGTEVRIGNEETAQKLNEQNKSKINKAQYELKKFREAKNQKQSDEHQNKYQQVIDEITKSLPNGYKLVEKGDQLSIVATDETTKLPPIAKEYTEAKDLDFLNSLVDEKGVSLATKMRQDKRTIALQLRKINSDLTVNFEPVSEQESKTEDTTKSTVEKINTFLNKLKCIPIGDTLKKVLSDPKTDATLFSGSIEAYDWDKAPKNVKEAKALFDKIVKEKRKYGDLTKDEKDLLLDYLPIQMKLTHPYHKKSDNTLYDFTVAIPARKSETSKLYSMDDDQVQQREAIIKQLVDTGKFTISKGDIEIQPGLFNIETNTGPSTVLFPDGTEVRVSNDYTGDLRDIESLNIQLKDGKYYITLPYGKTTKTFPLTIAIAGQTGTIDYVYTNDKGDVVTRHAEGFGSPGTPYLIIPGFLNLNKKDTYYPLKLNPRRIDRNTATTVAKLMQALAKGYATRKLMLNTPIKSIPDFQSLFGITTDEDSLTIQDILDDIIYWGKKTLQNDPDPANNKEHLKNKQLYIDFKTGTVKYGANETILGDTEEDMNKFINWLINNKSFSIDRSRINAGDSMLYTYSIENGFQSVKGTNYVTSMINNKVVVTNLSEKGPLFKGQFIRLKPVGSSTSSDPVVKPTPKPVDPQPKPAPAPATKPKDTNKEPLVAKITDGVLKGAKALKQAMQQQDGTITISHRGSQDIYDGNDKKVGSIDEFTFEVKDGKINGIEVNYDSVLSSDDGVLGVIKNIIKQKYPDAVILADTYTFTPFVQTDETEQSQEQPTVNPRVEEVYSKTIQAIQSKFKDKKPSKADITNLLDSLLNKTTQIAKLYGFKDAQEAYSLLKELGSNGKTLEQNLIEYMENMGDNNNSPSQDRLANIAATVFSGRRRSVNRLITDRDKKQGYKTITDQERKQLHKILGSKRVSWVDNFIDVLDYFGNPAKAFGATSKSVTEIFKGAKEGTGYHEAFHNVSLFALSNEQRAAMYEEARSKYKELQNKTDKEVEEFLADRFMDYALDMQTRGEVSAEEYKGLTGFFRKMWDFVKSWFGGKPSYQDINTLFKKIYSGNYSKVKTNKDALVYFDNTYGKDAKIPLTINGRTLTMNSQTFSKIISNLTAQLLFDNDITSLESVRKGINIDQFRDKIKTLIEAYTNVINDSQDFSEIEQATALVNIYTEIVDNWDAVFKPFIEAKLATYGIRRRVENATIGIDEDLKGLINDEIVSAWEVNSKHNAKAEVRMLFLALQNTLEPDPITKLPQYANPDVVWYNVISKLHGITSVEGMLDALKTMSQEVNTIRGNENDINPYSELRELLLSGNETLRTQFFVTMKKHRNKFINFSFEENGDGLSMNIGDADINKRSSQLNQLWSKRFAQTNPFTKEGKENIKNIQKKYKQLLEDVKNDGISEEEKIRKTIELLSELEIIVDEATILNIIQMDKYKQDNNSKSLSNFLLSNSVSNIFSDRGNSLLNKILKDKVATSKIDSMLQGESMVKTLSKSYVKMNPSSEDDSVPGPEGNAVYSYCDNNTITSIFEEWLKDEEFLNEISKDVYSQNSLWLRSLRDPQIRKKIGVKTILALMNKDNYSGSRGYLDISDKEDLIIKLKMVMEGNYPPPTLANKKSYYSIYGLPKALVRLQYTKENGYQLNKEVIDIFKGYAIDELNSIKLAYQQRDEFLKLIGKTLEEFNNMSAAEQRQAIDAKLNNEAFKIAYSDLVENYHYRMSNGAMILDGNGYKSRYFNFDTTDVQKLEQHINSEKFNDELVKYINARVNDTIKLFIDAGIINVNSRMVKSQINSSLANSSQIAVASIDKKAYNYIPVGKEGTMFTTSDSIAQLIADYAINSAISTIEFEKVVSGDLAFYKAKKEGLQAALDDRVKRYSALTSTRQAMNFDVATNEDYEVDFDTRRYRSTTLATNTQYSKQMYDIMFDKYVGTEDKPGLLYSRFIDFAERGVRGYEGKDRSELYQMAVEDAKKRLGGYLSTDPTDAQVWISPKMFRKLAILNGEWSKAKEEAYKLLESDKKLTEEEELKANLLVMQPLKYVHYGFMYNSKGLKIPVYDKMSLATVFRRNAVGTDLKAMYDYMIENDVDMIKMETAVKSGNRPKITYYNENGQINDLSKSLVYEQDFKYIGKQLVTDPHEVERSTLLTQFIKIAASNVVMDGEYELDGNTVSGSELIEQYIAAINNLSDRGAKRIINKFGFKDGKVDKRKLIKMLNEAAHQTDAPQNLIDALQYSEQDKDYYIELSALPSLNWIHSRIISLISKETIDITTPGNAFYQTTSFGLDSTGNYRKVVGDNTLKRYDDKLRFKNEHGRLEVKLSINLFRGAIPSKYKTFEEQRKYILANKELFAFAYRVPTQGMNSTLPIEIVDVLPTNSGDVIFLPLEVTTLTGSDFDIDKMYLARYNYYDSNGIMKKIQFIDRADYDSEEEFLEAIWYNRYSFVSDPLYKSDRNKILGVVDYVAKNVGQKGSLSAQDKLDLIDLAQDYSKYLSRRTIMQMLDDRVDDFEGVKQIKQYVESRLPLQKDVIPVSKFIEGNRNKSMWELNSQEAVENRLLDIFGATLTSDNHYIDATTPLDVTTEPIKAIKKKIIKYFEKDNTIYPLAPLFPAYQEDMKSKNTGADSGIGPMALINVFRTFLQIGDIKLNTVVGDNDLMQQLGIDTLNKTYDDDGISILDWTSALINAHVDAAKDPYIVTLNVNKFTYNTTAFMISAGFGQSTFYFLPQPILKDLANNYMRITGSDIGIEPYEKYSKKYLDDTIEEYESMISRGAPTRVDEAEVIRNLRNTEWLEDQLKVPEDQRDDKWYATQLTILDQFLKIQQYADSMRDAINSVQIDTKKYGINSAQLIQFEHLIEKVKNSKFFTNPEDLFNKTFIQKKYDNSIGLMFKLLGNELIDFSQGFIDIMNTVEQMTYTYYSRREDVINSISNEIKSALFGQFFNSYLQSKNMTVKDLFYGKNSVVSRIEELQKKIAQGEYRDLKDNELLKMLLPNVYNNDIDPMTFENSITKQRDKDSKDAYTFAWMDLLEHEDESIRQLGNDLILYSFYMGGGLSNGVYNFYDLVPYGYLANFEVDGKTYQSYIKNLMYQLNSINANDLITTELLDNIFKSGWRNDYLVPEISLKAKKKGPSPKVQSDKNGKVQYIRLPYTYEGFVTGLNGFVKPYVKLYNRKDPNSTNIFKLVGYFETDNGIEYVYGLTNKLGYDFKGFRIKESTVTSQLPSNQLQKDYSKELDLGDKFKNGDLFVRLDPFSTNTISDDSNIEVTPDGEVEANNIAEDISTYTLYSGGAEGSDTMWKNLAQSKGIKVQDITIEDYDQLNADQKSEIEKQYREVVKLLRRSNVTSMSKAGKLVRRDIIQANNADTIIAIGTIGKNGLVEGGTGYATTRGIVRGIPVYVFDQSDSMWKQYDYDSNQFIPSNQPTLTKNSTVIGTRQLEQNGIGAIESVINNSVSTKQTNLLDNMTEEAKQLIQQQKERQDKQCKG